MNTRAARAMLYVAVLGPVVMARTAPAADAPSNDQRGSELRRAMMKGLERFNPLVGAWRGVGQPRSFSSRGAWKEEIEWVWKVDRESAVLAFNVKDAKLLRSGVLAFDPRQGQYVLKARLPDGGERTYTGKPEGENRLVLVARDEKAKEQHRLTLRTLHDDRITLLVERQAGSDPVFARQAEIGYTRIGGNFAAVGDSYPVCIVTGGRGTATVTYKGQTYYVCCTGCKQAFEDDPEGILAEAAERAKQRAEAKGKSGGAGKP